jgi:hypothetical protein
MSESVYLLPNINIFLNVCRYLWMYTVHLRTNVVHHGCLSTSCCTLYTPNMSIYLRAYATPIWMCVIYLRTQAYVCSLTTREETTVNTRTSDSLKPLFEVYFTTVPIGRFYGAERYGDSWKMNWK